MQSIETKERPCALEELCVPCYGVHERDQETVAGEVLKRRRYGTKQGPRPGDEYLVANPKGQYGRANTWKEIFKQIEQLAPRVGTVVLTTQEDLFKQIAFQVNEFRVRHVEVCRGTERYRPPKTGVDTTHLTHRLTVILHRETGQVEVLGEPEKWKELIRGKQIRKAKPARLCVTVFGDDDDVSVQRKNQVGGDRFAIPMSLPREEGSNSRENARSSADQSVSDQPDQDMPQVHVQRNREEEGNKEHGTSNIGHPPKNIPYHGPAFLRLTKDEQEHVRNIHHRMGHPDPQKFARFLQSNHESHVVAGALDYQCDTCMETQKGYQSSRPSAIHEDIGFNRTVGMDVATWTNGKGQQFDFTHYLDEGTLFHQAQVGAGDEKNQVMAFEQTWIKWAGPPQHVYTGPAREYTSDGFLLELQEYGITLHTTARDSHWQLGRTEVYGWILKRMLDRMDGDRPINAGEEFQVGLLQALCAKNALTRVKGFTPEQAVMGVSRKLPASISSDTDQGAHLLAVGNDPEGEQFRLSLERRAQARKAFIETDSCNSLRRALLKRARPMRENYESGDWVLYWRRKGGNMRRERGRWYGPARIVQIESKNVIWLVHANRLARASPEQLRPASIREWKQVQQTEEGMTPVDKWLTEGEDPHEEHPEQDGVEVPIPESEGEDEELIENVMFGDDWEVDHIWNDRCWEIDITPGNLTECWNKDPNQMALNAVDVRGKRPEVSLKELGEEDQLRFAAAKDKEIRAWLTHKAVQRVSQGKIPDNAVVRCRWLLTWKGANGDEKPGELSTNGKRAKARLVVIGFEDPCVSTLSNDSPTLTKDGRQTVLQQVCSYGWELLSFDVSTAFLHGKGDGRLLGIHPPSEMKEALNMSPTDQCQLNGGAYGRVDAPRLWFDELTQEMLQQGCKQHPLDPCVFTYGSYDDQGKYQPHGAMGIHVDDGIGGGDQKFLEMLKRVESRSKFGSFERREFKYTGVHYKQWDDGSIDYDQTAYIEKIQPIQIDKTRRNQSQAFVNENERKSLRSLVGALQYAAVHTRPDLSAKVGELQMSVTKAKVEDLVLANKVLYEAKSQPVSLMVVPIQPECVTFCAFSDASFLSGKHSHAHQGTLIFVTTPELLNNQKAVVAPIAWTSKKVPRVVRSTLSAEASALSNSVDRLLWLRMLWAWINDPDCEWSDPESVLTRQTKAAVVTDCRSMFDILTRAAVPSCSEHRATIECLLIRERLRSNCVVRWVSSQAMLADCLTKSMDASVLRSCLQSGRYSLYDEQQILKQRADKRQRWKWIKDQRETSSNNQTNPPTDTASVNVVQNSTAEFQDYWMSGPGNQVRRIHVCPRIMRFVPIGVTGCPVPVGELQAYRETRVTGGPGEKDFWTGTNGSARFQRPWVGETIFYKKGS